MAAVLVALGIQRRKLHEMVYCFMGEMTSETGIAHESIKYSENHNLPIHFIIEDNGKSVCTDTREAWRQPRLTYEGLRTSRISYYRYETKYPHAGAGKRVQF
jgi:pyruvate dehydrogenase E1 component alpha subunit